MKTRNVVIGTTLLLLLALLAGCARTPGATVTRPAGANPPGLAPNPLHVAGLVQSVSLSARVILLDASDMGIDTIAVSDDTVVTDSSGAPLSLREIQAGQMIQAAGEAQDRSLLASRVTVQGKPVATRLSARLDVPSSLPNGRTVVVRFTLTNNADVELWVLNWYTPLEGIFGEVFRVTRDGQTIPYQGPLATRAYPLRENYVRLGPGESVSAEVDLAEVYDLDRAGVYTIRFLSPSIGFVTETEADIALTLEELGPVTIFSVPATVTLLEDA